MELFVKIDDDWKLLTLFTKSSILDVWRVCEYASAAWLRFAKPQWGLKIEIGVFFFPNVYSNSNLKLCFWLFIRIQIQILSTIRQNSYCKRNCYLLLTKTGYTAIKHVWNVAMKIGTNKIRLQWLFIEMTLAKIKWLDKYCVFCVRKLFDFSNFQILSSGAAWAEIQGT